MTLSYNPDFPRWEVYSENPIIRGGEEQPVFVSPDFFKCAEYMCNCEK